MKTESPRRKVTVSDNQPSITVVSNGLSSGPSVTKNEEVDAKETTAQPTAQPLNISDTVREMLQDEMFKLVQLQQINFMSLMQIVGSSFANLPNMSQQMQQARPFQLERSQTPNTGGAEVTTASPRHPADGFLKIQMTSCENSCHVSRKNINPREMDRSFDQQNHNGYDVLENPPHTSVSSSLPENQSSGKRQIPPFQSLLHQFPARSLPLLSACLLDEKKPKLIPLAKNINHAEWLPLLKLKPQYELQRLNICPVTPPRFFIRPQPQRRECWDSLPLQDLSGHENEESGHLNLNSYNHKVARQTLEQKNNRTETLHKGAKYLHLDKYGGKEERSFQDFHAHLRTETSLADKETGLQKTSENVTRFPLLYLKPWSQSKCPSTLITVKYAAKGTDSREPSGQSALPLLCSNLSPPIKFQTPKLIPLHNLIAFEQSRQVAEAQQKEHKAHPGCIQLLKADIKSLEVRQDKNNQKRQKRRIEKKIREKEGKKPAMTFQQDDSVGLADTEKQTKDNRVKFSCDFSDVDTLFKQDAINVSELHYLASVSKNPAELQDASTNTDTVLISHQDIQIFSEEIIHEPGINRPIKSASTSVTGLQLHQDMQTVSEKINSEPNEKKPITFPCAFNTELLSSCVPQALPPDLHLNLTFPTEAAEKPLPNSSDITSDLTGQKYISVVDIENGGDLKNLPDISEPAPKAKTFQAVKTEFPTAAKLHHMAASVTNVIPPEAFEKEGDIFQNEPFKVLPETEEEEIANNPLTLRFLHEDFSINSCTETLARKISKKHLSAKLQEMDRQLLILQNVAERMDKEFHSTKLLVETIEDVDAIAEPEKNGISFFAPGVKVTKEEHYSFRKIIENSAEEGDLETEAFQASYVDLPTPPVSPSVSAATLQIKKSSSDINFRSDGLDESFSDRLQMTGLSGVSDIIADLIAEGGTSASELGLTERQAEKISRLSGEVSKYSCKMKRDKKELQAWMKRKRKERLAEYMDTLTEKRAKEHNPFLLRKNMHRALSTQDFKLQRKKKNEKDKALFSEHHNHRVSDALVLMHELLSDTVQLPSNDYQQISPRDFKRPRIASAGSYRGSCQSSRKTFTTKAGFSQTRSFSSLSSDVTQRRATHQTRNVKYQRNLAETAAQASEESNDDALSIWSVPDEIQKILYGSSNLKKDSSQEESCFIVSHNSFDSVSESTSSILSKLDWNAVEAMVANVEEQ